MVKSPPTVSCVCKHCGERFLTWKDRIDRGQVYCSIRCSADSHTKPISERFLRKLAPINENGCVNWTGTRNKWGYGMIGVGGKTLAAHRVAWEQAHGPIPSGMWVLHRCDNRLCCNPDHLFLGTAQDNMDDCREKQRQACGSKQGSHKLTEKSVMLIRDKYAAGNITQNELAREFGVRQTTISRILLRESWKHI